MRLYLELREPQQAYKAMMYAWRQIKAWVMAGHKLALIVRPITRSDAQNAHFHALIDQIAAQAGGDLADPEDAKRILISAFRIDTKGDPDLADDWARVGDVRIGRGLRGETVLLGKQSRRFPVKLASAFIDWLYALGAEYDVIFKEVG